jgi:PKD repeat protein
MSMTNKISFHTGMPRIPLFCIAVLLCMVMIAVPAMAAGLADTPWPRYGQNSNNTGLSPYTGPQTSNLVWTYTTSGAFNSQNGPAIGSDGTLYIPNNGAKYLYAIYPNGSLKWKYPATSSVWGVPAIGSDGTIYFASKDYNLYALNADGTLKWKYTAGAGIGGSPAIGSDGTIYFLCDDKKIYALNADGTLKWTYALPTLTSTGHSGSAVGPDGSIYVSVVGGDSLGLYVLNADGTLKWTYKGSLVKLGTSPVIGSDGSIYIGSSDNNLTALNADGTLKWKYLTGGKLGNNYGSAALGPDGTIYIGAYDKYLYAVNADGTLKWKYLTGSYVYSTPIVGADGTVYFGSNDKVVYALNADGTLKWSYTTGGTMVTSAAIGSDGTLYIGSTDNILYAFRDVSAPVAAFTGTPTSGTAPLTVTFTDASTNTPTSWSWDFGDGNTTDATAQNPVHTYAVAGTYTVNLTATNSVGSNTATKTDYITVTAANSTIQAAFTGAPTSGTAPLAVTFTDASTGNITSWLWEFGDGENSTVQSPVHTYTANGTYTVNLTVTGPDGTSAETKAGYITVSATAATIQAAFSATPTSGTVPLIVTFTDASTNTPTSWSWDFGDGNTTDATAQNPVHTYAVAGTYTVNLTATNSVGSNTATKTDYITVTAANATIQAAFTGAPTSGTAPLAVTFTDASTGNVTSWLWEFGDGENSTVQSPSHTYTANGTYTVNLTVTGPDGTSAETKAGYITVSATAATIQAAFSATPTSGTAPLTVQFTDASIGNITGWSWDFNNDGVADSTVQSPGYTYSTAGTYSVNLTVTGPDGSDSEIKTGYITVGALSTPVAAFTGTPASGSVPLTVQFTDASTNSPAEWAWDFDNDGTIDSTSQNPQYTYSTAGNYTVSLKATNAAGSTTETKAGYITVAAQVYAPVAEFSANATSGAAPLTIKFTDASTNTPTSWNWDFGDNATSTEQSPVHTYAAAGTYTVTLKVTNAAGSNTYIRTGYITATTAVITLPDMSAAPTDPDGDGLYEDLSGNGALSYKDLQEYFLNMDWIAENEPVASFDFSGNGKIGYTDLQKLFARL